MNTKTALYPYDDPYRRADNAYISKPKPEPKHGPKPEPEPKRGLQLNALTVAILITGLVKVVHVLTAS